MLPRIEGSTLEKLKETLCLRKSDSKLTREQKADTLLRLFALYVQEIVQLHQRHIIHGDLHANNLMAELKFLENPPGIINEISGAVVDLDSARTFTYGVDDITSSEIKQDWGRLFSTLKACVVGFPQRSDAVFNRARSWLRETPKAAAIVDLCDFVDNFVASPDAPEDIQFGAVLTDWIESFWKKCESNLPEEPTMAESVTNSSSTAAPFPVSSRVSESDSKSRHEESFRIAEAMKDQLDDANTESRRRDAKRKRYVEDLLMDSSTASNIEDSIIIEDDDDVNDRASVVGEPFHRGTSASQDSESDEELIENDSTIKIWKDQRKYFRRKITVERLNSFVSSYMAKPISVDSMLADTKEKLEGNKKASRRLYRMILSLSRARQNASTPRTGLGPTEFNDKYDR